MKKLDLITGLVMMGMAACCLAYIIARHDDMVVVGCFSFMFLLSFFGGWGCLKDWANEYKKQKKESEQRRRLKECVESRNFKEWEKAANIGNKSNVLKELLDEQIKKEIWKFFEKCPQRYTRTRDNVRKFFDERGITAGTTSVKLSVLYGVYSEYALNHGYKIITKKCFIAGLKREGVNLYRGKDRAYYAKIDRIINYKGGLK